MKSKLIYIILRALKDLYKYIFRVPIMLYNKNFEEKQRSRLKVHDFSIISADCAGGVITHRVGERFNSPTVNLWMEHGDCIKLISNLRHYLQLEPKFIKTKYGYPVAEIDDITIYFNHYENEDEARQKWNERKERVEFDKLYLVITAGDDLTDGQLEQIKGLDICNRVVFMTEKRHGYDFIKVIKPHMHRADGFHCMDRTIMMKWHFENKFDYVEWLNAGAGQ